jgi:hypothetical protein
VIGRMAGAGLLVLLVAACQDRGGSLPAPSAALSAEPAADAGVSARRPSRRYYLGRTQARCEVFWVDGDDVSFPTAALCPADLQPGERIRLAGKTCMREGSDPDRREPMVCPEPLYLQEARDHAAATGAP